MRKGTRKKKPFNVPIINALEGVRRGEYQRNSILNRKYKKVHLNASNTVPAEATRKGAWKKKYLMKK